MSVVLARKAKLRVLVAVLILVALASISLHYVLAQPPEGPGAPMPLIQYGIVRVFASELFTGNAKITITSLGYGPFFVSRLTLFTSPAANVDILLDSINVDETGTIQVSGFLATTKVVVVPAGLTAGEVVTAMPSYLDFLLVKNPMGNDAIILTGGDGGGLVVGLRFTSGSYNLGTTITAVTTVVAPTNTTISMTMS